VSEERKPPGGHPMAPSWIWMQIGIVVCVVAGAVIAIVKLS
jgi:hypothetical protein